MFAADYTLNPEANIRLALFLNALSECGNVTAACATCGFDRRKVARFRAESKLFDEHYTEAEQIGVLGLEDEMRRRAVTGWDEPVFHNGNVAGFKRKFSDSLLTTLVKGGMPEKYAERTKNESVVKTVEAEPMDPVVRDRRLAALAAISATRLSEVEDLA